MRLRICTETQPHSLSSEESVSTAFNARGILGYCFRTNMADGPAGFHFDELNKVRVLEPEISQQTQELKEECKEFVDSKFTHFMMGTFRCKVNCFATDLLLLNLLIAFAASSNRRNF